MTLQNDIQKQVNTLLQDFLTKGVDVDRARDRVEESRQIARKRTHRPDWRRRVAANTLVEEYSQRAALRSLVTGLPGGLTALPMALLDAQGALASRAELALALHLLVTDEVTEKKGWQDEVIKMAYSIGPSKAAAVAPVAVRAAKDLVFQRGAKFVAGRVGQRLIPVVGGVIGAVLTMSWINREGRRMLKDVDAAIAKRYTPENTFAGGQLEQSSDDESE